MKITKTGTTGLEIIKMFEGFRSAPYKCPAGIPTIGYGATFYPDGKKVTMTDKAITEQEGTALLQAMLVSFEKYVDSSCRDDINQNQFDALVSFAYNLGPSNLQSSTILKKVNANPNGDTVALELMTWV
jgi:lysozyme